MAAINIWELTARNDPANFGELSLEELNWNELARRLESLPPGDAILLLSS